MTSNFTMHTTHWRGLPLVVVLTPGNVNDSTTFEQVMETISVPREGRGRPRTRPDRLIADKGYSSRAIRAWCAATASP